MLFSWRSSSSWLSGLLCLQNVESSPFRVRMCLCMVWILFQSVSLTKTSNNIRLSLKRPRGNTLNGLFHKMTLALLMQAVCYWMTQLQLPTYPDQLWSKRTWLPNTILMEIGSIRLAAYIVSLFSSLGGIVCDPSACTMTLVLGAVGCDRKCASI